jgi:hypothetical protein
MQNKIEDLRNHLFATIEELRDKEKPMDIHRAKAVSQVAQSIIDSARVECDYIKLGYAIKSAFVEVEIPQSFRPALAQPEDQRESGAPRIAPATVHAEARPLESKLTIGGIYGEKNPHSPKLAAGIKDMREKLNGREKAS